MLAVVGATLRFDNSKTRVAAATIEHRMRLIEFTETGGEDEMLVAGNVLVANKQHVVLEQRGENFGYDRLIEGLGQIDAFDKNSEVWRIPFGLDDLLAHHNTPLFSVAALRGIALLFPDRLLGTIENTGNNTACIPRGSPDSNH